MPDDDDHAYMYFNGPKLYITIKIWLSDRYAESAFITRPISRVTILLRVWMEMDGGMMQGRNRVLK